MPDLIGQGHNKSEKMIAKVQFSFAVGISMRYARDLILFEDEKFTICQPAAQTFPITRRRRKVSHF